MPTIQEILEDGLGADQSQEKVAAVNDQVAESDDIEKLAAEIGLVSDDEQPVSTPNEQQTGQSKEASMSLESLYEGMFPGSAGLAAALGTEKVASQDKVAAEKEAAMGAVAFDRFAQAVDAEITKMAEELSGSASVGGVNEATDGKPVQTMKDNQPGNSHQKIDTTPKVDNDAIKAQKGGEVVGTEEQRSPAGNGEQLKEAAVQRAFLLSQLDEE